MADFWIIEYKSSKQVDEKLREWNNPQHIAIDVDSVVEIKKSNDADIHTFVLDNENGYIGKVLKKVTEDEVMAEMEKLPPAR